MLTLHYFLRDLQIDWGVFFNVYLEELTLKIAKLFDTDLTRIQNVNLCIGQIQKSLYLHCLWSLILLIIFMLFIVIKEEIEVQLMTYQVIQVQHQWLVVHLGTLIVTNELKNVSHRVQRIELNASQDLRIEVKVNREDWLSHWHEVHLLKYLQPLGISFSDELN